MSPASVQFCGWTRRRFWCVVGVLCLVQAGLIALFGEREREVPRQVRGPGHFRLIGDALNADQLSKTFFAIDPTVFPLPSLHGFSERAWLRLSDQPKEAPDEKEAPAWLALDVAGLGTNILPLGGAKPALPFSLADQRGPESEPWPPFLTPEFIRTQSRFDIQGELSGRLLNAPAQLPAWASSQLLTNSTVQIAVDSAGQVISVRLLGRSRSLDADTNALDVARRLRFQPVPAPAPVWGRAVFEWQTLEATNARPAILP